MKYSTKNIFCRKCNLYAKVANPMLIGRGNKNASVLLVGEAPGRNEDEQGQVFIGRSGQFLQYVLNNVGLDCYITNSVLCRPTDKAGNNATPKSTNIECCLPFTIDLILEMKPKVIVALGAVAMQQLLGFSIGMEIARGKEYYHNILNATIIPTFFVTHSLLLSLSLSSSLLTKKPLSFNIP